MQVSTIPTAAFPDRIATQRLLNDLTIELSRSDAELTNAVRMGNRIGSGWDNWFMKQANLFMDARDAYMQLMPQDVELSAQLRADALDLAESSGNIGSGYRSGSTFGSGWDTTLDRKIDHARAAAERLYSALPPTYPGQPTPPSYPTYPTQPPSGPGMPPSGVSADAARAAQLVQASIDLIRLVPANDRGDASTKQVRLDAYNNNKTAQQLIEQHFNTAPADVASQLRRADASLEDAAWQLARKPSPDGRFNGVDIPGALRDSQAAVEMLMTLAGPTVETNRPAA